ncbi:MAG: PEGA domain-containing protein [Paludibacter sp.]|nr:PEGA domain-containing protein [Paludibacter sp.]
MRKEIIFGALALTCLLTSCATIFSGRTQNVLITSNPSSATIYIDEVEAGKTPFEAQLVRKSAHSVRLQLDGYQTYQTNLTQTFNGWYLGNILIGGVIGLVVDASTGAMFNLSPNMIYAEMNTGTTVVQPAVIELKTTPTTAVEEHTKDQLNVGDKVKFYSYRFNGNINGVVKKINGDNILIEFESFGIMKTVEIKKSDLKRI